MVLQQLLTVKNEELKDNSIKLPHTYLEKIIEANIQPPFYFNITTEIGISIIVSINEFTSDLGTIELSKESLDNLLIDSNFIVDTKLIIEEIPKAKTIRLTPLNKDFFTIPEYDTILEHHLSKYSILYNNQTITLNIFDKIYTVIIDNVEPDWEKMTEMADSNMVDIVDIDLNVDINNKFIKEEEEEIKRNIEKIKKQMEEEKKKEEKRQKDDEEDDEKRHQDELKKLKEKFLSRFS
jgi:hypothetical protein